MSQIKHKGFQRITGILKENTHILKRINFINFKKKQTKHYLINKYCKVEKFYRKQLTVLKVIVKKAKHQQILQNKLKFKKWKILNKMKI